MARNLDQHVKMQLNERKSSNWAIEKPKLKNARKLRGSHFIDAKDMEFKETIKKRRGKLEIPMEAAMSEKLKTMKRPFKL